MNKFFANATKGVFATTISAANVLSNESFANELITAAFVEGKNYVVTGDAKVASDLQEMFMYRVNTMINAAEEIGNVDALDQLKEEGKLAKEVYEWIVDSLASRTNPLLSAEAPTIPVVIAKDVNMSAAQVIEAMYARGLAIDGVCKTPAGEGTVLGFDVSSAGTIVVVRRADGVHKLFIDAVKGTEAVQTKTQSKGDVSTMKNENKGNFTLELNIDEKTKAVVDQAIAGEVPAYELTAEERAAMAEQKLANDLAQFQAAQADKQEKASTVANSAQAQALLGLLGAKAQASNVPAPQEKAPATPAQGAPVVAPANRSARQAAQTATGVNATQNKNQTNGGNVQMTNVKVNNGAAQVKGAQASNRTATPASAAFGGQQVTGRQAAGAGLELNPNMVGAPVGGAWAGITPAFELPTAEYTGTNARGGQDFVWYVEEATKYEGQIMDLETLAANGFANPALGITGMKFSTPASIAEFFKRDVKADDFMWVEVFFGNTSYEFMFSKNSQADSRPYIFSRNITRKQTKGGNWYCEYVSSRRSDKLLVVIDANGKIREARKAWNKEAREFQVVAEDAPFVQEVGAESWVNTAPNYGIKIGQATFIQLMMFFDEQQGLKAARDAKLQA